MKFWSHFPVPFAKEPGKTLRLLSLSWPIQGPDDNMVVSTCLPDVVCRLCRLFLRIGWAVLLWNGVVSSCLGLCFPPYYSELPLNTQALSIVLLRRLCFPPALFSEWYLLLGPHYWGLVSFSVVQSYCFLFLKTETSLFLGQRPLDSVVVWGW